MSYKSGVIDISGLETLEISDLAGAIDIDGFHGMAGKLTLITNRSAQNVTLKHLTGSPSSRINAPGGADSVILPGAGALVFKVDKGWHVIPAGYAGLGNMAYQNSDAVTLTGQLTITATQAAISMTSSGVNAVVMSMTNGGGSAYFGLEDSTGTYFGVAGYDLILGYPTGKGLSIVESGVGLIARFANGGLSANPPLTAVSAAKTFVAGEANGAFHHPSADATARIWTIPSNAAVPYRNGTMLTFINDVGAGALTISINTDTLVFAGSGATGSRTLAAGGVATAVKMSATRWMINGTNLT